MLMASGCGTLTPSANPTPRCQFDPPLLAPSPDNLPPTTSGNLYDLIDNRIDSKVAYKTLYLKHRDLSSQAANCIAAQTPATSKSALDERVDKMKARMK